MPGHTEHLKVTRLTDGKGLGKTDERTSMKWVANVTGYAGVLAKLNAQYAAPVDAPAAAEVTLEPRAAASAPMYSQQQDTYKKRLKHKDARSYSHADLTAIMGGTREPAVPVKVTEHSVCDCMIADAVVVPVRCNVIVGV